MNDAPLQPECTCCPVNKGPHANHAEDCPMHDHPESLKAKLSVMKANLLSTFKNDHAFHRSILYWEGRCAVLRHENNQFRKKLFPAAPKRNA